MDRRRCIEVLPDEQRMRAMRGGKETVSVDSRIGIIVQKLIPLMDFGGFSRASAAQKMQEKSRP